MKYVLALYALIGSYVSFAQVDTSYLKGLYDRCLDFNEEKLDSIRIYASLISNESKRLRFEKGDVLSSRLMGLYEELRNNYEKAIEYYLNSLEASRRINGLEYEISAMSDLAIVYATINEPQTAKGYYLQVIKLAQELGQMYPLLTSYNNLAVIYTQLEQYDSARILLNEAIKLGKPYEPTLDLSSNYNNLGNLYFREKNFKEALHYFNYNYNRHIKTGDLADIWVDILNIADVYIEQGNFNAAKIKADSALMLATELGSKSKEADSYAILSKLNEKSGNYKNALAYQKKFYELDTAIVHSDTYKTIAELQERFNAREREAENKLLQEKVEKEKLKTTGLILLAIGLGIIGMLVAIGLFIKRRDNKRLQATNELIVQQNEKLSELNYEKNSLISIVSHDLNTPFATIQIWSKVLLQANGELNAEQQKAADKIHQASLYGEGMINRILNVEKSDIAQHKVQLESFDLVELTEEIVEDFKPKAEKKGVHLELQKNGGQLRLLSDRHLVTRICENLVSNAIKFTPRHKNISVRVHDETDSVCLQVKDEGVGIREEELPYLFSKYSKISSQPTDGEASNGLGLSIVKRIVEELNGKITCESEPGQGTLFTVLLKK